MKQLAPCSLCVCAVRLPAAAHVLDEYLQVARIALAPVGVRIELRLIPGVRLAERISALINADGDGRMTTSEERAYARRVLRDIELAVNGVNTPLRLTDLQFPGRQEMREGSSAIRLTFVATATFNAGHQQLYFRNGRQPELGAYLVNALVPSTSEIKIGGQARDPLQREMRLSFHVTPADTRWPRAGVLMLCLCLVVLVGVAGSAAFRIHRRGRRVTSGSAPISHKE